MDWSSISSTIGASFAFLLFLQNSQAESLLPREFYAALRRFLRRVYSLLTNYIYFKVDEYDGFSPNELYTAVQLHLSDTAAAAASRARLSLPKNAAAATCTITDNERIVEIFEGTKIWWEFSTVERSKPVFSWNDLPDEKRALHMCIHKRDRDKIMKSYVPYLRRRLQHLRLHRQERFLYTNLDGKDLDGESRWLGKVWTSVPFKHPSNFDTLALHPERIKSIKEDLLQFASAKEFYDRVGRAWKRGYLLYGPPGTGKSSMIAAMANLLDYDIYDLELTGVKSNSQLRNLLVKTTNRSIIVIEDIDCSLDLTVERQKKKKKQKDGDQPRPPGFEEENEKSTMTLSGLLNFVDGLWSCCGDERIFVFTTNHLDKLDKALLRPGRMDMHIELSYCSYEAFKILAKNYLELEEHSLFEDVKMAFDEEGAQITPAEVSEVLTRERKDVDKALTCLIKEIKESKFKRQEEREEEERKRKEREKELKEQEEEEEEEKEKEKERKKEKKKNNNKEELNEDEDAQKTKEEKDKEKKEKKTKKEGKGDTNKEDEGKKEKKKNNNKEESNEDEEDQKTKEEKDKVSLLVFCLLGLISKYLLGLISKYS